TSSLHPGATGMRACLPTLRSEVRYTSTAIALHWLLAALVIAQIAWGWWSPRCTDPAELPAAA
ncbi:MAG: hypothetical protein ABI190_10580, partial [Casimicrobiaceae bacterium]